MSLWGSAPLPGSEMVTNRSAKGSGTVGNGLGKGWKTRTNSLEEAQGRYRERSGRGSKSIRNRAQPPPSANTALPDCQQGDDTIIICDFLLALKCMKKARG